MADGVADNSSSAHVALGGPVTPLDGLDLRLCGLVFSRDEAVAGTGAGGQVGDPPRRSPGSRTRPARAATSCARGT